MIFYLPLTCAPFAAILSLSAAKADIMAFIYPYYLSNTHGAPTLLHRGYLVSDN